MRAASGRLAGSSSHRQASIKALISAFRVSGLLAAQTLPLWRSTIVRLIASPIPRAVALARDEGIEDGLEFFRGDSGTVVLQFDQDV